MRPNVGIYLSLLSIRVILVVGAPTPRRSSEGPPINYDGGYRNYQPYRSNSVSSSSDSGYESDIGEIPSQGAPPSPKPVAMQSGKLANVNLFCIGFKMLPGLNLRNEKNYEKAKKALEYRLDYLNVGDAPTAGLPFARARKGDRSFFLEGEFDPSGQRTLGYDRSVPKRYLNLIPLVPKQGAELEARFVSPVSQASLPTWALSPNKLLTVYPALSKTAPPTTKPAQAQGPPASGWFVIQERRTWSIRYTPTGFMSHKFVGERVIAFVELFAEEGSSRCI